MQDDHLDILFRLDGAQQITTDFHHPWVTVRVARHQPSSAAKECRRLSVWRLFPPPFFLISSPLCTFSLPIVKDWLRITIAYKSCKPKRRKLDHVQIVHVNGTPSAVMISFFELHAPACGPACQQNEIGTRRSGMPKAR
jgi:hypothetical protein